jgi:hypothetical protein
LRYKKWDRFPYAINAESIEIHDIATLPTRLVRGICGWTRVKFGVE